MILEEYNKSDTLIFTPANVWQKREDCPKTAIAFFAHNMEESFLKNYKHEVFETLSCGAKFNLYKFKHNDKEMLFFRISLGAPASVAVMEEVAQLGVENFLISGSCGVLDKDIKPYTLIVPDKAIRDEGTSYHYAPSSDIVELDKTVVDRVENYLKDRKIDYIRATTWTTDAIYRETAEKVERRIKLGAKTVEMECSAMACFSKYRNVNFAQVLYGADVVSKDEDYDLRNLLDKDMTSEDRILNLVVDMATKIY